jgi:hypothetical protein
MMTRMHRRIAAAGAVALVVFALSAARGAAQAKINVSGEWTFQILTRYDAEEHVERVTFTFTQDGEDLTGTYIGSFGGLYGSGRLTGTVTAGKVTFTLTAPVGAYYGAGLKETYTTTTLKKDMMSGDIVIETVGKAGFTAGRNK